MPSLLGSPRQYPDLYTWSHPIGDVVLAHQDGAVSLLIEWEGIDAEFMTESERASAWMAFGSLLHQLPAAHVAEFHLWREADARLADDYLTYGERATRGGPLAQAVRTAQAEHLRPYGMRNSVGLVLTHLPAARVCGTARRALAAQARDAETLEDEARSLLPHLPGARLAGVPVYLERIRQSYDRTRYLAGAVLSYDPQLLIPEQLIDEAPRLDNDLVRIGDAHSQVLLVYLYPDATPAWFAQFAAPSIALHVCHVVMPVDTRAAMGASERKSDLAEGALGRRGASQQRQQIQDLRAFREFVAANSLQIFRNSFIIHLHGTPSALADYRRRIADEIEQQGGQVRGAGYVQLPYFRAGQPGQGYRAPLFRPDHTMQVANMLPVQTYRSGTPRPESLRLGRAGQLISFDYSGQELAHAFTVAITGGGKGVEKVATIAETYPFGIDWYIAEIGGSYRWIVEGFGGVYSQIDPRATVVNPLPPYRVADNDAAYPLDAVTAGGTVGALAFLLTDGRTTLTVHERAAAEAALQLLYAVPGAREAPTLPDFLVELERADFASPEQEAAGRTLAGHLHSFLETGGGRIFANDDNLVLSEGITGVDLKEVDRASRELLKFYLVFLGLRFSHLAFARRSPARVLLDEMHKFVATAPEIVGRLISELARMGRKDAAAIDLVTQGTREIDAIEQEVLNSMPLRTLLFRTSEHADIAARIGMPPGPLAAWQAFPNPLAPVNLPWRPGLRSVGDAYYNLYLTFPDLLLDLAATGTGDPASGRPADLDLKGEIGSAIANPLERLAEFRRRTREYRQARNPAP